ncbi:hypothetical protein D9619_008937 [Psilocybe cf. subviscida]|uniref:Nephrocystin 3-like N-terminal domain-containing protein n=1 Tax=Psilocybe cf. subviscida TaxID=2480587 RepID=A0A8H5BU07_9AGAR|nr:hypothetical protein D9619_008937 [Psilocybe cf. subviscida]
MSMISNAIITGGFYNQSLRVDQRHVYTQKSAMDRLQEAVSPTAFHNSGERLDPPKCHPKTRVAARDKIERWALRTDQDTMDASILWLSGAAGAGKSAIAQTVAEDFHSKGLLVRVSSLDDPTQRNHARSLVSTIFYQLFSILPPIAQSRVLTIIDQDPLIFTRSLLTQLEALIVNPLRPLFENDFWISIGAPRLIVIDGLDECLDRDMQRNVLLMLSASVSQFNLPFIFLLASRPEYDIRAMFSSSDFLPIDTCLFLDDTFLPDRDIELFLRDQFEECRTTHPFRHTIPPDWPSDDIVRKLTNKSSGQFIYASVVAKYVKSARHRPHHRLDVVLNLRPASRDLPFSELDALYAHIFSSVDDIERVLNVISFHLGFPNASVDATERILRLDTGEVTIVLCNLASIITISCEDGAEPYMEILHASLTDYLLNSTRSKEYFIDADERPVDLTYAPLGVERDDDLIPHEHPMAVAMWSFIENYIYLDLTEALYNAIRRFSILRLYDLALNIPGLDLASEFDDSSYSRLVRWLFEPIAFNLLPALFEFLAMSDSSEHLELFQHHQFEYDLFLRDSMKACSPESPASLLFALVAVYPKLPIGAIYKQFILFDNAHFKDQSLIAYQLRSILSPETGLDYVNYLSDFLRDPKRSREVYVGPKVFGQAAKWCLIYLCDHTAFAQKVTPRISEQQRVRRKYTPWKWHRRVLRHDIGGPGTTPWLWLKRRTITPNGIRFSPRRVLHRTNDLIYVHNPYPGYGLLHNEPVITYRVNSEKYHLALIYLNYFLPRAAKLDDLVHMCQRLTFASRSQDFPRKSAQARSNMQKYAEQWE